MEALEEISAGLKNSSILLLKKNNNHLECQFLNGGLVHYTAHIKCRFLAAAIWQESVHGIIEGERFISFKNGFSRFSLRVKTKQLYFDLSGKPEYSRNFELIDQLVK